MKRKHPEKIYTFRSNDLDYKPISMPACTNYKPFLDMEFSVPTAALPRSTDAELVNDQRFVDITQIGIDSRLHKDLTELTVEGEDEPPQPSTAIPNTEPS